jgi:hypothetical protein
MQKPPLTSGQPFVLVFKISGLREDRLTQINDRTGSCHRVET